jgi:hypothetical protein
VANAKGLDAASWVLRTDEKHGGAIGLNECPVSPSGHSIRSQSHRRLLSSRCCSDAYYTYYTYYTDYIYYIYYTYKSKWQHRRFLKCS